MSESPKVSSNKKYQCWNSREPREQRGCNIVSEKRKGNSAPAKGNAEMITNILDTGRWLCHISEDGTGHEW